ncbi:aspartate--tRNA(Asn) ligase [Ruminococcaceae bacterium OttesenSCG-928-A16]|nr:aspartate--tRNA(Asn) ligase [Ruminococcaceae bacterium OttesenSCG-928-A16]
MGISGVGLWQSPLPEELAKQDGQTVTFKGTVHNIREFGGISFVILRTGRYLFQTVWDKEVCQNPITQLAIGDAVEITGTVRVEPRAQGGVEVLLSSFTVLNHPTEPAPLNLADRELKATLGTNMEYRTTALRHPKQRAVFRISEGVVTAFREFMMQNGFTEIHSPKIVGVSAEGGAEVFKLDYFGETATLTQSPQFYKQTCVAFFDRVFEVGPVYRAELHNTSRHLNEYTGLDFEMGFINSMEDVMQMEVAMLRYVMQVLKQRYAYELELLKVTLPEVGDVPSIRFADALALLKTLGGGKNRNDLTPEDEVLLCDYYRKKGEGEFVFVTHFPSAKRPFYVMDDPENPANALSFDLLLRGLEITTGGQRIHNYEAQVEKFESRGLNPADFESYIGVHRVGLPPHGGLGIGLERLVMKICDLSNIREASLFPRDINHLRP